MIDRCHLTPPHGAHCLGDVIYNRRDFIRPMAGAEGNAVILGKRSRARAAADMNEVASLLLQPFSSMSNKKLKGKSPTTLKKHIALFCFALRCYAMLCYAISLMHLRKAVDLSLFCTNVRPSMLPIFFLGLI